MKERNIKSIVRELRQSTLIICPIKYNTKMGKLLLILFLILSERLKTIYTCNNSRNDPSSCREFKQTTYSIALNIKCHYIQVYLYCKNHPCNQYGQASALITYLQAV